MTIKIIPPGPVAIVLKGREAYTEDGTVRVVPMSPAEQPVAFLDGCARLFQHHGQPDGTVILDQPFPSDAQCGLQADGWNHGEFNGDGWTTFWRKGSPRIHVGVESWLEQHDRTPLWDQDPVVLARMLAGYHRATGTPWHGIGGMAGHDAIRALYTDRGAGKQPLWRADRPSTSAPVQVRGVDALVWRAPAAEWREQWGFVHRFDTRGAYVAAANTAELAWSALNHTKQIMFDARYPGYWLVSQIHIPDTPVPLYTKAWARDGLVWLTTPTMQLLSDLGHHPDVFDSWTVPRGIRILRPWAEDMRDALDQVERVDKDPVLREALKITWADSIGLLNRRGGRIYRPDWREIIIDKARANLTRKIRAATDPTAGLGLQAVQIKTDEVWYLSHKPLPPKVPGEGPRVGQLVYKGTQSVDEFLEESPHA